MVAHPLYQVSVLHHYAGMSETANDGMVNNLIGFVRTLRAAGMALGTGHLLDALRSAETVGLANREDFYWALHASLVTSPEQRLLFDQAFYTFFRNPRLLEQMMSLVVPSISVPPDENQQTMQRRLADAFMDGADKPAPDEEAAPELDAFMSSSHTEVLQHKDFAQMSAQEQAQARELMRRISDFLPQLQQRRFRPAPTHGRIDMHRTLREAHRYGGEIVKLRRRRPATRTPALVLLCDVSGSMARYSRMFLHFAHAVANAQDRVHSFVFATLLTNISPILRYRDVDQALGKVGGAVEDWSGGTRIAECLRTFNYQWARRVLGQGALVVLLSDGLEKELSSGLAREAARLGRAARQFVWLNPLMRYEDFTPAASGIRAMLPHVDAMRPAHNLASLAALGELLAKR